MARDGTAQGFTMSLPLWANSCVSTCQCVGTILGGGLCKSHESVHNKGLLFCELFIFSFVMKVTEESNKFVFVVKKYQCDSVGLAWIGDKNLCRNKMVCFL